jgi:hypothetical protein
MNIHRFCTKRSLLRKITRKCYSYRVNQTSDCNGARLRSISYLKTERNISQTVEQPCVREREQMLLWTDQKLPRKYKFHSNTDRIFISTYKSYGNGKEWGAQGYWDWYRPYWRSWVIIWALYRLCRIVRLAYVVWRYVAVVIGCVSEMCSCSYVDLSIHVLFHLKYISRRILLMSATFYCS